MENSLERGFLVYCNENNYATLRTDDMPMSLRWLWDVIRRNRNAAMRFNPHGTTGKRPALFPAGHSNVFNFPSCHHTGELATLF